MDGIKPPIFCHVAGMWAGAHAGLGIAVRTEMGLPAGCKVIHDSAVLPALPNVYIFLLTQKVTGSQAIERLIEILRDTLKGQLDDIAISDIKDTKA